jgi:putative membrane protein
VAGVLGIINVTIRPILRILTFPINILTLGAVGFVLNTLLFWSATLVIKQFTIDGFWWAALGALIVSVVSAIGNRMVLGSDGKLGRADD